MTDNVFEIRIGRRKIVEPVVLVAAVSKLVLRVYETRASNTCKLNMVDEIRAPLSGPLPWRRFADFTTNGFNNVTLPFNRSM